MALPEEIDDTDFPLVDGVILPVDAGIRDVDVVVDIEGVTLPDIAGVMRPPRIDVTDAGLCIIPTPAVGGESFTVATKTPQFSGHVKYCFLGYQVSTDGILSR